MSFDPSDLRFCTICDRSQVDWTSCQDCEQEVCADCGSAFGTEDPHELEIRLEDEFAPPGKRRAYAVAVPCGEREW